MKPYPRYKPTGLAWLPSVPEHWEVTKIRTLFQERTTKVSDKDYPPLSVSKGGVVPQIETVAKSDDGDNRKLVCKGDFVINSRSDRKGSSGVSSLDGSVSLVNLVLRPRKEQNSQFFHYLLKSDSFIEEFYRNGHGIVADLWTTRYSEMKSIYLPLPPPSEQARIVHYLDEKTAASDELVRAKERQIELLRERKQALVSAAVTRGLDPATKLKDSGVSWIGKIPAHWEVMKIRELFSERTTKVSDKEYPPLSVSKGGVVPQIEDVAKSDDSDNRKLVCRGDFVINSRSDRKGSSGVSMLEGSVSLVNLVLKPRKMENMRFYHYLLKSDAFVEEFYGNGHGIVADLWTTRYSELKNISIPVPPRPEQALVVKYLDDKMAAIDELVRAEERQIALLQELRTRLVSDAVTGAVEVS